MFQPRSAWIMVGLGMVAAVASAQSLPALAPAASAARMTLEQLARAPAPARAGTASTTAPAAQAVAPPSTAASAPAAPTLDLLEIVGSPEHPRARIAIGDRVYSVSAARPQLGSSRWTLAALDVESRSAILRRGSGRQQRTVRLDLGQRQGAQPAPDGR